MLIRDRTCGGPIEVYVYASAGRWDAWRAAGVMCKVMVLSGYLGWSELVIMLMNRQRRALQDFIGSTRVIALGTK
jgi:hypothetical protein